MTPETGWIEWRDISTAPRDGTSILVVVGPTPVNTTFRNLRNVFQAAFENGNWISLGFDKLENKFWKVTDWMPLPVPPEPKP